MAESAGDITLRVALAQINPTVGDLEANAALMTQVLRDAHSAGADLVVFPELVLDGYPVEDLALRPSFQRASRAAMHAWAAEVHTLGLGDLPCLVGYLDHSDDVRADQPAGGPLNAAALVHRGELRARYVKHHLPNYGVFDEARYFVAGDAPVEFLLDGAKVSIAICEDLWRAGGPVAWARETGPGLLAVLNASPYERSKDDTRLALCQSRAREAESALVYVNLVGGQDELVFDGDSMTVDADGSVLLRAPQFESGVFTVDVTLPRSQTSLPISIERDHTSPTTPPTVTRPRMDDLAEVHGALVLGLRDYVEKNGFTSVMLGLSGGIDSALVASLACDALGASRVFGVGMPSRYSSEHSRSDARDLADRTGVNFREVPIEPMFAAFQESLDLDGLAAENLQARIRGMILMSLSNAEGHLVLATGNKSELAVGYSTIYGDAVGGFAPIKDVPKTLVWELSRWRNDVGPGQPIPPSSITKPPSAELRPGQLDTDSLPDYAELDAILEGYVSGDHDLGHLATRFDRATAQRVIALTDRAEYKRRQYPPGTKISLRAFGRDRRLPITHHWHEA